MTSGLIPNENQAPSRASGASQAIALVGRLLNRRPDSSKSYVVTTEGEGEAPPCLANRGSPRALPQAPPTWHHPEVDGAAEAARSARLAFYVAPANLPSSWASSMAGDRIKRRAVFARGLARSPYPLSDRAGMPGGCGQVQARVLGGRRGPGLAGRLSRRTPLLGAV